MMATTLMAGSGLIRPVVSSLVSRRAGRHEQGVVIGMTQSLSSIAQIIGPILAGALIQHHLLYTWALLAAGFAAVGGALEFTDPARAVPTTSAPVQNGNQLPGL
jgi:MFS transporter, DHA1 family, tetracycline resistance protein